MTKKIQMSPKLIALDGGKLSKGSRAQEFYRELEIDTLARTLWGEARGEGTEGMEAIACVVLNRMKVAQEAGRFWWGNNIIQICQKPYQFSCWNRSDPNYRKLLEVDNKDLYFATAVRIARRALIGQLADITGGATHYHARGVMPYWAKGEQPTAILGNHIFYNLI